MKSVKKKNLKLKFAICLIVSLGLFCFLEAEDKELDRVQDRNTLRSSFQVNGLKKDKQNKLLVTIDKQLNSEGLSKKFIDKEVTKSSFSSKELQFIKNNRRMAKVSLAMIYTAQQAFLGDFGRYSSDLDLMGFKPQQEILNFVYGFSAPTYFKQKLKGFKELPGRYSSNHFVENNLETTERYVYSVEASKVEFSNYKKYCQQSCLVTENTFEMLIVIPYPDNKGVDVYTLNEKKEIRHAYEDLKL